MNMRGCEWAFPLTREVWVIPREGGKFTRVAGVIHPNEDCIRVEAVFSPDGRQVAYTDEKCNPQLVNADGSGRPTSLEEFPWGWFSSIYPQWGQKWERPAPPPAAVTEGKIVEQCEGSRPPQICVRDANTNQVKPVIKSLKFDTIFGLAWSPDGRQIVFDAGSAPQTQRHDHKLYLVNADGSGLKQITYEQTNDIEPVWSPDGRWLAFHRNCDLWLIRPDGSKAQRLLAGSETFCANDIAWSPNSWQLALLNAPADIAREALIVDQKGQNSHVIYTFEKPVRIGGAAWSPDGRQLACWYEKNNKIEVLLINADGSGEAQEIKDEEKMPWSWRSDFWPQWREVE
jgi:TolB protein